MAVEWQTVRIEDIADKVAMGPFGSSIKVETFVPEGVPVISGAHLHGTRLKDGDFNFVTPAHADKLKNANVFRGDVIFTHAGNIGQVAYIPENSCFERYVISQRQFYLRCNRSKAQPEFVTYYFKSHEGQHKLLANASQVGVPSIARPSSYLKTIEIPLPSLSEQRAIAHILGTLDDKIELNRRMNETLEAIARAIFKSWFVDFDPVRAKASGEPPESICRRLGLTPDLLALFPDRLVDSELGEIPAGWEATPLPEVIDFLEGPGIRNWQYTEAEDGIKFINIRCIKDGDLQLDTASKITAEEAFGKYKHFQLAEDDIVISISGTLGRFGFVRESHLPLSLNTSVVRFRPVPGKSTLHFIAGFTENQLQRELEIRASGSAQRNFGPMHLKQIEILLPPYQILKAHANIADSLFRKRQENLNQIDGLVSIRDALLPKLLFGELRVPVAGAA